MSVQNNIESVFSASAVIPVLVIEHIEDALPLGRALYDGGLKIFEVTMRTPCALATIRLLKDAFPDALVGAGTALNCDQYDAAVEAGAAFVISPGSTPALLKHAANKPVPLIPGTATATEIMTALESGYTHLKFYPAEINGGAKALKAISAAIAQVRFCPTGGITAENLSGYLALDCVNCVGGTWMLPNDLIKAKDWAAITELTKTALSKIG
jgi:2-dehydro-3-deoxyphosphogluconate aldolase/(4S)-4-hydroxy-2-oxoglutarate aldolase